MKSKVCPRCGRRKPYPSGFYRNGESAVVSAHTLKALVVDRFRPECKSCTEEAKAKKKKKRK